MAPRLANQCSQPQMKDERPRESRELFQPTKGSLCFQTLQQTSICTDLSCTELNPPLLLTPPFHPPSLHNLHKWVWLKAQTWRLIACFIHRSARIFFVSLARAGITQLHALLVTWFASLGSRGRQCIACEPEWGMWSTFGAKCRAAAAGFWQHTSKRKEEGEKWVSVSFSKWFMEVILLLIYLFPYILYLLYCDC